MYDASVPSGAILIWSGASNAIPSGYVLCDGQNGTPDLRDRFIIGAGSSYSVGSTGGATEHSHANTTLGKRDAEGGTYSNGGWGLLSQNRSTNSASSLPPYYALCYIMKTYPVE